MVELAVRQDRFSMFAGVTAKVLNITVARKGPNHSAHWDRTLFEDCLWEIEVRIH